MAGLHGAAVDPHDGELMRYVASAAMASHGAVAGSSYRSPRGSRNKATISRGKDQAKVHILDHGEGAEEDLHKGATGGIRRLGELCRAHLRAPGHGVRAVVRPCGPRGARFFLLLCAHHMFDKMPHRCKLTGSKKG